MLAYLVISILLVLFILFFLIKKVFDQKVNYRIYRQLVDSSNIGYYRYRERDGVILAANRAFVNILELGKSVDSVIGRSLSELLIYIDGAESIREKLKIRGELKNHEYHFKTLEGKDKSVLHNSYIRRDPYTGEKVIEVLIQDTTEEWQAYEKMKNLQERYEKLFKNSGDIVIICKIDDFSIEEVNPITSIVTGFTTGELIGKTFVSLFHPSARKALEDARKDIFFKGTSKLESVLVCRNGSYKEVILTMSSVEIEDDRILMAVIKDVSSLSEKRAEEEKRKKELEDFWKAALEREERIRELRIELESAKQQLAISKRKSNAE